jgi:hypothetical protein
LIETLCRAVMDSRFATAFPTAAIAAEYFSR